MHTLMALVPVTIDLIRHALTTLDSAGCTSRRILSLGYPDLLASPAHLAAMFGDDVARRIQYREDSAEILRWHNTKLTDRVAEPRSLFAALGFEMDVVDIASVRGGEMLLDLNVPVPEALQERYAVVIDAGTLEHCFNIAQAARNIASFVALGGVVLHANPLNLYNHGFYNMNPTWYHDFYGANGFAVEQLRLVANAKGDEPTMGEVPAIQRFTRIPEGSSLVVLARRLARVAPCWPIQSKYRGASAPRD
jgi:hypothetical protein